MPLYRVKSTALTLGERPATSKLQKEHVFGYSPDGPWEPAGTGNCVKGLGISSVKHASGSRSWQSFEEGQSTGMTFRNSEGAELHPKME